MNKPDPDKIPLRARAPDHPPRHPTNNLPAPAGTITQQAIQAARHHTALNPAPSGRVR
jgi:hypothetical protein